MKTPTIRRLAGCFRDKRNRNLVEHSVEELLLQRIGALAMGYEDLNDHDSLRHDPVHGLMSGKTDLEAGERSEKSKAKALAGHSTLNRLEQSALGGNGRYKKTIPDEAAIERFLLQKGLKAIPRKSKRIVLDFDATDDPLHKRTFAKCGILHRARKKREKPNFDPLRALQTLKCRNEAEKP
ncbi:MAG: transposase [Opitutales bacterium]|nr:transposase [Opitutales bacterium]